MIMPSPPNVLPWAVCTFGSHSTPPDFQCAPECDAIVVQTLKIFGLWRQTCRWTGPLFRRSPGDKDTARKVFVDLGAALSDSQLDRNGNPGAIERSPSREIPRLVHRQRARPDGADRDVEAISSYRSQQQEYGILDAGLLCHIRAI